jgi:hypothetical protein
VKMLLSDFNAEVGREVIFKSTMWNKTSREIICDIRICSLLVGLVIF